MPQIPKPPALLKNTPALKIAFDKGTAFDKGIAFDKGTAFGKGTARPLKRAADAKEPMDSGKYRGNFRKAAGILKNVPVGLRKERLTSAFVFGILKAEKRLS